MPPTSHPEPEPAPDLIVLSDLHLGRGRNPRTGRYHNLETFFFDDDLRRFLGAQVADAESRGRRLRVVFNGDTFDFLRTEPLSDAESRRERRFGPDLTPARAAEYCALSLAGHPNFTAGLADVVAAGHEVVFLPGNHDLELQFDVVHAVMRGTIRDELERRGAVDVEAALGRVTFEPWFHHEPGRVWIEHGCQFDPECAFRFPLRRATAADADPSIFELDMPLGNFFQRYLYNAFGALTFIVPSTRANARYSRWLLLNEPRKLVRVVASHVPFIVQVLRRMARGTSESRRPLERSQARELERLARESGLGEKLHRIDALKAVSGDLVNAVAEYARETLRFALTAAFVAVVGALLWFSGGQLVESVDGVGWRAVSFLALNFFFITSAVAAGVWTVVRQPPEQPSRPLRQGAAAISRLVDVPVVVFGHTHDESVANLDGGDRWYFNTGTWIAVFTHDVLMPRERVQYTFLRMRDAAAELLHWSPGRREAMPVVLLDDAHDAAAALPETVGPDSPGAVGGGAT